MVKFAKDNRFNKVHYLYDETQNVAKKYGAVCTPDFLVIIEIWNYNIEVDLES